MNTKLQAHEIYFLSHWPNIIIVDDKMHIFFTRPVGIAHDTSLSFNDKRQFLLGAELLVMVMDCFWWVGFRRFVFGGL